MILLPSCDCCGGPTCDAQFGAGGGSGTTVNVHVFPPEEHNIWFTYDAYSVPDQFIVRIDGEIVFDTGSISGSGRECITKPSGITDIEVTVIGPGGTAWVYAIGCGCSHNPAVATCPDLCSYYIFGIVEHLNGMASSFLTWDYRCRNAEIPLRMRWGNTNDSSTTFTQTPNLSGDCVLPGFEWVGATNVVTTYTDPVTQQTNTPQPEGPIAGVVRDGQTTRSLYHRVAAGVGAPYQLEWSDGGGQAQFDMGQVGSNGIFYMEEQAVNGWDADGNGRVVYRAVTFSLTCVDGEANEEPCGDCAGALQSVWKLSAAMAFSTVTTGQYGENPVSCRRMYSMTNRVAISQGCDNESVVPGTVESRRFPPVYENKACDWGTAPISGLEDCDGRPDFHLPPSIAVTIDSTGVGLVMSEQTLRFDWDSDAPGEPTYKQGYDYSTAPPTPMPTVCNSTDHAQWSNNWAFLILQKDNLIGCCKPTSVAGSTFSGPCCPPDPPNPFP